MSQGEGSLGENLKTNEVIIKAEGVVKHRRKDIKMERE